jgi:hypothetical protein
MIIEYCISSIEIIGHEGDCPEYGVVRKNKSLAGLPGLSRKPKRRQVDCAFHV